MNWRHRVALRSKQLFFARKGEPYLFAGQTLRFLPGSRPVRRKYRESESWYTRDDVREIEWIESNLKAGGVAFDVGAHWGVYSVLMAAKLGPAGTIVAFEPDPHARAVLERNVKLNELNQVRVEALACSDREGEAVFFSRGGDSNSSLARAVVERGKEVLEEIRVSTITLDRYCEAGIWPDVIKIDAEGAEIHILRGARSLLESKAVQILCELHPYAWPGFGTEWCELEDLLTLSGRELRYLDETREVGKYGMTELEIA
jgi:FkbM family methyltransferase